MYDHTTAERGNLQFNIHIPYFRYPPSSNHVAKSFISG